MTLSLIESATPIGEAEQLLREVASGGQRPADRTVRLEIGLQWIVGEAGVGGGLKAGQAMDTAALKIVRSHHPLHPHR